MADPSSASADRPGEDGEGDADQDVAPAGSAGTDAAEDLEALRRQVEEKYDFENFTPAQMQEMTADEWEAAFDADSWVVGVDLLDRVEAELKTRISTREVFAAVEWFEEDGEPRLLAYSDEGYAVVYPDGSIEGEGTVMRDVRPTVVLCSMDDYEVPAPPDDVSLPSPDDVPEGTGRLGNLMLQFVAAVQVLAGVGLFVAWLTLDLPGATGRAKLVFPAAGLGFLLIGLFLFTVVANARLSDRFRAEEFRDRLRAIGHDGGDPPEFLPVDLEETVDSRSDLPERRDPDGA
ncbi:MAG: hypothetical protein ABEJ28_02240 [Salinigranum sp.]